MTTVLDTPAPAAAAPAFPDGAFPTILLLTDDCISPGHGTGAALLRHFAGYPQERLVHAYLQVKGEAFLVRSRQVREVGRAPGADGLPSAEEHIAALRAEGTRVDLIYACVFGEPGLALLEAYARCCGAGVPVVQHFQDLLYAKRADFEAAVLRVAPVVDEFWALEEAIRADIAGITGREVAVMNVFRCDVLPQHKTIHRELGPDFDAVIMGNSHMPWALDKLARAWGRVREAVPDLGPVRWLAHPSSVMYVRKAGVTFEPHVDYCGFLVGRHLHERLCAADAALVPFNIEDMPEYHYARYSIPSRLTELLHAGLPVFAAAGRGTATCDYITRNRVGVCATLADGDEFVRRLQAFLRKRSLREELGRRARAFAERHCDVNAYRATLFGRLGALLARKGRSP